MSTGQTDSAEEKQRIAFAYLQRRTFAAHKEGDGVLVNHLCATAINRLAEHSKAGTLLLRVPQISWALVFPLFWLIDEFMLDAVGRELKRLKVHSPAEQEFLALLKVYHGLLQNPFASLEAVQSDIENAKLDWVSEEANLEQEVLLTHLIELLWSCGAVMNHWKLAAGKWRDRGPSWAAEAIRQTEQRLDVQTALTILDARLSPVASAATVGGWLGELWECSLDCNWVRIDEILAQRVPQVTMEMPIARYLFDARHFNRTHGVWGDDQATGLTRRRLAITSFPKLAFNELRTSHCERAFSAVLREGKRSDESYLLHVHRLAMLSELEALRLWDWFDWTQTIAMQSRILFEMANRGPKLIGLSFHAIILSVQSLSYESTEPVFRNAILAVDFASPEERRLFFSRLLAAQDVHAYLVLQVLGDFADAIPHDFLEAVTDWSLKYLRIAEDKTLLGSKSVPLGFWRHIFPFLSQAAAEWSRLLPAVHAEALQPMAWQVDDGLLNAFLVHAPIPAASEVFTAMLGVTDGTDGDRYCRWLILSDALIRRTDLRSKFARPIIESAPTPSDSFRLSKELGNELDVKAEAAARRHLRSKVESFITRAINVSGPAFARPDYRGTLPIVVNWNPEDADLVHRLIETIDHAKLRNEHAATLILLLRMIVGRGPAEFAEKVSERLPIWLKTMPGMETANDEAKSFWSQSREKRRGEILEELTSLIQETWLRLPERLDAAVRNWAQALVLQSASQPAPRLVGLFLRIAHESEAKSQIEWVGRAHAQIGGAWAAYSADPENWEPITDAVNHLRWFFKEGYAKGDISIAVSGEFVRRVVAGVSSLLEAFSRSHSPNLRTATARLLHSLRDSGALAQDLDVILRTLSADARARVRTAAQGHV